MRDRSQQPQSRQNVLVYRLGSLGDTVVALPCLHLVRRAFPEAHITLLTNRPVAAKAAPLEAVLGGGGFFDEVLDYPVGTRDPRVLLGLLAEIRRRKIDTVVNLAAARTRKSTLRDEVFFHLAGAGRVIGSPRVAGDFAVALDPKTGRYEWEAQRLARRLEPLGRLDLSDPARWDLRLSAGELTAGVRLLGEAPPSPLLGVCLGTKMPAKDWEESNWAALLARLAGDLPDWGLVIVGAPDEAGRADRCSASWRGPVFNLCGKASPRESAAALRHARAFVSHDSGPMHLAAAVGVPCVAIFAARNLPGQWFPCGARNEILYHQTECFGCNLEVCEVERKRCILSITVDEVQEATLRVLEREPRIRSAKLWP